MWSWLPWERRRRARLRQQPLPASWAAIVERGVPLAAALAPGDRALLDGHLQVFLDDKAFEGCGGLEVTDEIRVTIAAHACLLLVGLDVDVPYPELDVVRVYPSTYRVPVTEQLGSVLVEGAHSARLGESSRRGYLVLSWDAVRRGARDADGHNVALHEFAHQLDTADGVADGAPILDRGLYGPWARVLGRAFEELQHDVAERRRTLLDAYGATSPPEFFAVATETFFERPRRLKREDPALYDVLSRFYGQDPAA